MLIKFETIKYGNVDFVKQNSITARIEKMRQLWLQAANSEPGMIIWQVKADESEMVDAFYLVEESENGQLPELFFQLDAVFTSYDTYAGQLMEQLLQMYHESMKYYTAEGMAGLEKFSPLHSDWNDKQKSHPSYIIDNLSLFSKCVQPFDDAKLVVYLSSPHIYHRPGWQRWWKEALEYGLPANLIFMLRDLQEEPYLDRLLEKFPGHIQAIRTDLKMQDAMRQEAKGAGDPTDPAVRYRLAILDMADAAGKRNDDGIHFHTQLALSLAREMNNLELQATALLSGGIHLFNLRKRDRALEYYDKAGAMLNEVAETKSQAAQVASQVQAARGALLFGGKRWKEASAAYQLMARYGKVSNAPLLEMEGWRMAGYCARKIKHYQESFEFTRSAYVIGIKQDPEAIPYTTLPHVGNQLIELAYLIAPDEVGNFEKELKTLLGHDWQTQFRTPQAQS